jgi:hypothetical protein
MQRHRLSSLVNDLAQRYRLHAVRLNKILNISRMQQHPPAQPDERQPSLPNPSPHGMATHSQSARGLWQRKQPIISHDIPPYLIRNRSKHPDIPL